MLTRSQLIAIITDNQHSISKRPAVHPKDFCLEWIPKLYGIQPGETYFTKACIREFIRQCEGMNLNEANIRSNWSWMGERDKFPDYLPVIRGHVHKQYRALEALEALPRYNLD